MRPTYHLTPIAWWEAADAGAPYAAPSLAEEGFIHATDGADELIATANRHYRDDRRPFVALLVDLDAVAAPWSVEDARGIYPHIFGPIDRVAILSVAPIERDPDGRFTRLGEAARPSD
jgi:uncharacterized protein (DUF952 family)